MSTLTARAIGLDMPMLVSRAADAPSYFAETRQNSATVFELRIINSGATFYELKLVGTNLTYSTGRFPTGGTVTSVSYRFDGVHQFDLTGPIPASAIAADFALGGLVHVLSELFDGTGTIVGSVGDDWLYSSAGNDSIDGGAGADRMEGGLGNDRYVVDNWTKATTSNPAPVRDMVVEGANGGTDTVKSSVSYELPANVERLLLAGSSAISGTGNSGANVIIGNSAANGLRGGTGNDTLQGGAGADILDGQTGADKIFGGTGNDRLRGDLAGGPFGADRFYFDTRPNGTSNKDSILDFDTGRDFIHLALTVYTRAGPAGTLAQDAFHTVGVGLADAEDRIIYNKATGALFYDPDGTGAAAAVQFASITANLALSYADFIVY